MKISSVILILFLSSCYFAQNDKKVVNKIVAQVGDQIILLSDVEERKLQFIINNPKTLAPTECEVLEQLMMEELLYNQSLIDSLIVSEEAVESELEMRFRVAIEEKFNGDRAKMEEVYGKTISQLKEELRGQIKKKMLAQEMEQTLVSKISVTPKEVAAFFNKIPKDSIPLINMKMSFQQIVNYPAILNEDKEKARQKLLDIQKELTNENFELMCKIHSDDISSAINGGIIEASRGMMVPQFESMALSLKPGEISEIVETQFGYHILLLIERKGDDYICRHILKKPSYSKQAFKKSADKVDSAYTKLKMNQITWEQAVIAYSNDEMTKENNGVITNPYTGEQTWEMDQLNEIDQQIYLITDRMEKGNISKPSIYNDIYERKDGVRIVRLMNRIPAHKANLNDDYALIKLAAENDKKTNTINDWINSKVTSSYLRVDENYVNCTFKSNWKSN
jgi:peptidyl-prolyl cis-trans isomerase SurA